MIKYLEKKLNKKIIFDYNKQYNDVLKKFQNNKIDFTCLGPLPYIELKQRYKEAIPLVNFKNKHGQTTYTCSLISFVNNTKTDTVALTQPLSTCGFLAVNSLLQGQLKTKKFKYCNRHDLVSKKVLIGEFDLGGVKSSIAKEYYHLGIEELKKTEPFPTFALVLNSKTLSNKEILNIKKILLETKKEEYQKWNVSMRYGTSEAHDADYNTLRQMKKNINIPAKGNF